MRAIELFVGEACDLGLEPGHECVQHVEGRLHGLRHSLGLATVPAIAPTWATAERPSASSA
jgi:hypothetical protein